MLNETELAARIEQLKKDRDAFIAQAERQIAAFGGAIAALEQLFAPKAETQKEKE